MTVYCTTKLYIWHVESSLQQQCKTPLKMSERCIYYLVNLTCCCSATWWKSKWTHICNCMGVCFPSFCFFFLFSYISTSLLSIHHVQSAASLSHSPQTLALLQMRIDPTVNLISMILYRAFSFTALHSAKKTWMFQSVLHPTMALRKWNTFSFQTKLQRIKKDKKTCLRMC